jgi:hypothetical protein
MRLEARPGGERRGGGRSAVAQRGARSRAHVAMVTALPRGREWTQGSELLLKQPGWEMTSLLFDTH